MKILVPNDFSKNASQAITFTNKLALATNSKLTLLYEAKCGNGLSNPCSIIDHPGLDYDEGNWDENSGIGHQLGEKIEMGFTKQI